MAESKSTEERINAEPIRFSQSVSINNLPFIFEGDIPQIPSRFEWNIIPPDWQKQAQEIRQKVSAGNISRYLPQALEEFEQNKGSIGKIIIYLKEKNMEVGNIFTQTWQLPKEFEYENIHGIGRFLTNNLLAFADIKSIPILTHPYPDKNAPLSIHEITEWSKRNNFKQISDIPNHKNLFSELEEKKFSMARLPQKPDLSQPITSILLRK